MATPKVPMTPALKQRIQTAIAVKDQCNEDERKFLGSCEKILSDPGWDMTEGRVRFVDSIIKKYITGADEDDPHGEINMGDFKSLETNDGWKVIWKGFEIGVPLAKSEVRIVLNYLSQSIDELAVVILKGDVVEAPAEEPAQEEASSDFPETPAEVPSTIYADESSPTGYCLENGTPCNDDGSVYEVDDLPYVVDPNEPPF